VEAVQRRENVSRMGVVVVRPSRDGVATDVGVGHTQAFGQPPHFPLLLVQGQTGFHRLCSVDVVPEFRWHKPLLNENSLILKLNNF